jgi:hypothetical protein
MTARFTSKPESLDYRPSFEYSLWAENFTKSLRYKECLKIVYTGRYWSIDRLKPSTQPARVEQPHQSACCMFSVSFSNIGVNASGEEEEGEGGKDSGR